MQGTPPSINYRIDFLKYRHFGFIFSVSLLLIGFVTYIAFQGFEYHIDFTGGTEIRVTFDEAVKTGDLRDAVARGAVIQSIGDNGRSFLIRIGTTDTDIEKKVKKSLSDAFGQNKIRVDSIELVGAEVGKDTQSNAIKAVLLALILLLAYIAIRSEFRFGLGATMALMHDVLMVLVFLLLTQLQVSLHVLAAVLAVLGYSLNDTIVIFSKIRKNMKQYRGFSEYDIVNLSINQMLTRTILTSVSTFLSVLAIFLLGGETLRSLSLIMGVGVLVGTYSSVYIASAGMLALGSLKKIKKSEQA